MIVWKKGDIFSSQATVLVNPVNTIGYMGKGLAKTFRVRNPLMFKRYQSACKANQLTIGKLQLLKCDKGEKRILNFPTKEHFKDPSKLIYIEEGLKKFVSTYESKQITSIAFPKLGAGLGGLDWEKEVKPLMIYYLDPLPIHVEVFV